MSANAWAWSTFFFAVACGIYAWVYTSRLNLKSAFDIKIIRILFSLLVTHAVLTNLAFIIWICGAPIATANSMLVRNYWVGPMILLFSVATCYWLKLSSQKKD